MEEGEIRQGVPEVQKDGSCKRKLEIRNYCLDLKIFNSKDHGSIQQSSPLSQT
jgi:hypothetical protein